MTYLRLYFMKLFQGLGKLNGVCTIQLKEDNHPYALTTLHCVTIPLMKSVKELRSMEELGVIACVNKPIDCCSGMVVVSKKNNKVHICVDLTKLKQSQMRATSLPAVEETRSKLAKIFPKLDAKSGLWKYLYLLSLCY